MAYQDLVKNIIDYADSRTKEIGLSKQLDWEVHLLIDACYSGSAINQAKEWIKQQGGKIEWHGCELKYFKNKCELEFIIHTSCSADELAYDCGENMGGLWLNRYVSKDEFIKETLKVTKPDGSEVKQTGQEFEAVIIKK